jgi:hypothetical protein
VAGAAVAGGAAAVSFALVFCLSQPTTKRSAAKTKYVRFMVASQVQPPCPEKTQCCRTRTSREGDICLARETRVDS